MGYNEGTYSVRLPCRWTLHRTEECRNSTKSFGYVGQIESYVGTYFSKEYVKKNILRMTDDEIEEIDNQIKDEEVVIWVLQKMMVCSLIMIQKKEINNGK